MPRPSTSVLAEFAQAASSQGARRVPRAAPAAKFQNDYVYVKNIEQKSVQTPHVVVHAIPKTATPSDVLRALKDRELVSNDFAITNITPAPISLPRQSSMVRNYHITLPSPSAASSLVSFMQFDTLFPYPTLPPHQRRSQLIKLSAKEYQEYEMAQFELMWDRKNRRTDGQGRVDATTNFDRERMFGKTGEVEKGLGGKRVYLRGLTVGVTEGVVRIIVAEEVLGSAEKRARDAGLLDGNEGVYKLPLSFSKGGSSFVLTFDTVTQASVAARKLNMALHTPLMVRRGAAPRPGRLLESTLRAEVVW